MTNKQRTEAREQKKCDAFNAANPVGTLVRYWRGVRGDGLGATGKTRSDAQVLSGHTAVIWIEGCSGCVALSHVEAVRCTEAA